MKKNKNDYAKFIGIGFQMIAVILAGTYLGVWIDENYEFDNNLFTIIFSLLSVFIALYIVIKEVINMSKN